MPKLTQLDPTADRVAATKALAKARGLSLAEAHNQVTAELPGDPELDVRFGPRHPNATLVAVGSRPDGHLALTIEPMPQVGQALSVVVGHLPLQVIGTVVSTTADQAIVAPDPDREHLIQLGPIVVSASPS